VIVKKARQNQLLGRCRNCRIASMRLLIDRVPLMMVLASSSVRLMTFSLSSSRCCSVILCMDVVRSPGSAHSLAVTRRGSLNDKKSSGFCSSRYSIRLTTETRYTPAIVSRARERIDAVPLKKKRGLLSTASILPWGKIHKAFCRSLWAVSNSAA